MFDFCMELKRERILKTSKKNSGPIKKVITMGDGLETFDVVYYASILLILIHSFILIYM